MEMTKFLELEHKRFLDEAGDLVDASLSGDETVRDLIMLVLQAMLSTHLGREWVEIVVPLERVQAVEAKLYDRIATVISKTYGELGDRAQLPDDEALILIRKLLLDFDRQIINRNRLRKLRLR
jgi:hypothetical protein